MSKKSLVPEKANKWKTSKVFSAIAESSGETGMSVPDAVAMSIEREIAVVAEALSPISFMRCDGDRCPYASQCSLVRNACVEIGKPCYYETVLYRKWLSSIVTDGDIDINDTATMMLVAGVVELMLIKRRIYLTMTCGGPNGVFTDLLLPHEKFGPNDSVTTEYVSHPLLPELLAVDAKIEKKLKELIATPLERDKKQGRDKSGERVNDPSVAMAMAMSALLESGASRNFIEFSPTKNDMIEGEFEVEEQPE